MVGRKQECPYCTVPDSDDLDDSSDIILTASPNGVCTMTDQLAVEQITKVFTSPTQYIEVGVSDSDLVPDDYQAELIQMRESWLKQYFRVGDIANELVQRSVQQNMPVTAIRVYKAIGDFFGKAERTVR